jgi:hypothetical protein
MGGRGGRRLIEYTRPFEPGEASPEAVRHRAAVARNPEMRRVGSVGAAVRNPGRTGGQGGPSPDQRASPAGHPVDDSGHAPHRNRTVWMMEILAMQIANGPVAETPERPERWRTVFPTSRRSASHAARILTLLECMSAASPARSTARVTRTDGDPSPGITALRARARPGLQLDSVEKRSRRGVAFRHGAPAPTLDDPAYPRFAASLTLPSASLSSLLSAAYSCSRIWFRTSASSARPSDRAYARAVP